jgi:23S rRNA (guanosine2251-2'-O)-methyltransferase
MENLFGINSVHARLMLGNVGVDHVMLRDGKLSLRLEELLTLAIKKEVRVERMSNSEFDDLTDLNHQGAGIVSKPLAMDEQSLLSMVDRRVSGDVDNSGSNKLLLLILDGITDPRNLGACVRSAVSMGVDAIIVPKDKSAPLNEAASKTASGGASLVPVVFVTNLARCISQLQKRQVWVVGTLLETDQMLHQVDMTDNIAIVMGSEGKGIRQKTEKCCDFLVRIPMVNSDLGFNVSVATGIALYEVQKQRLN